MKSWSNFCVTCVHECTRACYKGKIKLSIFYKTTSAFIAHINFARSCAWSFQKVIEFIARYTAIQKILWNRIYVVILCYLGGEMW